MVLHVLPLLDHTPFRLAPVPSPPVPKGHSLGGFVMNNRFLFTSKVGAGTFGLIYLVHDLATGASYAAKIILAHYANSHKPRGVDLKVLIQEKIYHYFSRHLPLLAKELRLDSVERDGRNIPAVREVALHLTVHRHPNIATIRHVFLLEDLAVITLMDYFPQGDLFGNIIDRQVFLCPPLHQDKQLLMKGCMLQLIDVVGHCASRSIFHCDLKPENVMVSYDPKYRRASNGRNIVDYDEIQIFLIDFGLAMLSDLICCNVCRGSSFYMAPERIVNYNTCSLVKSLINMEEYATNEKSSAALSSKLFPTLAGDVWSLGVLFVNITCSKNPWPIANINDRQEVFYSYIANDSNILRSILPILRQFNQVLKGIFELSPNERVSLDKLAHQIMTCDFFNDPVEYNSQLCTPPREYLSITTTPVASHTEMDQCKASIKPFDCPHRQ